MLSGDSASAYLDASRGGAYIARRL
jgi:hypothetical protein